MGNSFERQHKSARQSHRRDILEGPARETAQRDGKMSGGSISVGVRSAIITVIRIVRIIIRPIISVVAVLRCVIGVSVILFSAATE